jgi:hypothetical protein
MPAVAKDKNPVRYQTNFFFVDPGGRADTSTRDPEFSWGPSLR